MRSKAHISSHPIHPMLVAFPIGLFITSLAFDAIGVSQGIPSLWSAGWYCILAGDIMAVLAAIPGAVDLFTTVPPQSSARSRGYRHALLNVLVLFLFIAVAAYRGGPAAAPDQTSFTLSAIGVFCLFISGWLGATLVYRNQIGVDHRFAGASKSRTVTVNDWNLPVCKDEDLAPGQLLLAVIQGARVVVGRCPDGLMAFDDHCTHKGGPLSDGALVGCTVQCPWHGSQFDVHSGTVVAGPAKDSLKTYDVQARDGQIYVFPKRTETEKAA
ncbi:MAG TPA: DUF2231 domain-containing protein [Terriglobales bacterium]|nr:DUF2231 domain-containing protein [Terriglobales bacterium]